MIGSPRVHHRVADSTNQRARELARAGAPHGTLVSADEQTAGRGRQGRAWVAPPRSALLASLVLRDLGDALPLVPLAAAVAVAEACERSADVRCEIKWPNDVWIDRRKVSGILVEARPAEGWAVLGIGLNVGAVPEEVRDFATSLRAASGADVHVEGVLAALLERLEAWLGAPAPELLDAWRSRDALRGSHVRWEGGEGVAVGIDDGGSLLVHTGGATPERLGSGEVHLHRRPN